MASRPLHPNLFREDAVAGPALLAANCQACSRLHFPATEACPWCGGESCSQREVGRLGRLHLWTVVTTAPPGYHGPVPYGFGTVEIDEGLRVVTRLCESDPAKLMQRQRLRLVLESVGHDQDGTEIMTWAYATLADLEPT